MWNTLVSTKLNILMSLNRVFLDISRSLKILEIFLETVDNSKKEENELKEWPSVSELNTRLRRIVTVYQKHYKQVFYTRY